MMDHLDQKTRDRILHHIEKQEPETAKKIKKARFSLERLANLSSQDLQKLLKEVPTQTLALSLRKAPETFQEKVYLTLPKRAAQALKDEMESMGKQKLSDVEAAQRQIQQKAKYLMEQGEIQLGEKETGSSSG